MKSHLLQRKGQRANERGTAIVEYVLLLITVGLIAISGANAVGLGAKARLERVGDEIAGGGSVCTMDDQGVCRPRPPGWAGD